MGHYLALILIQLARATAQKHLSEHSISRFIWYIRVLSVIGLEHLEHMVVILYILYI
jgi:hypothetical protein